MKNIIKIRIALWLILLFIIGWLLYMAIVPFGKISYVYDFKQGSYFISKLTPLERVGEMQNGQQKIIGDPVYFNLRVPRKFDKARLTMIYKNESVLPIIEAGVLADKTIWRYYLQPLENNIINKLSQSWDMTAGNGTVLLQRGKKYNSINEFLDKEKNLSEIAVYNYDFKAEYLLANYKSAEEKQIIGYSLRGPYQFYTYLKDEDLDFNFIFSDLNKNKDADPINLNIYYNNTLIDNYNLPDDGIVSDVGEVGKNRELKFNLANLPEGAYKIELRANDDIITKSIATGRNKMAFINKIWLADSGNKNISLFTDSQTINAQTANPASLQVFKIGSQELGVSETYKQFSINNLDGVNEIKLSQDDIILSGDGVFSFSQAGLINPQLKKVDNNFNIDDSGVNYIIASYIFPKKVITVGSDVWHSATAEFDLIGMYQEDNKYSFIISIPGLKADDDINDYIEIGEIRINLEGKTLFEKIKKIF